MVVVALTTVVVVDAELTGAAVVVVDPEFAEAAVVVEDWDVAFDFTNDVF